ncbi:metallophosphoesterase family protein [Leptospira ilyithenensis]|uniref:Phosphoesterase n=1 Tax=Leptospira ilyithenensis TaxID=2484901 RepID=A0A4R9LML7_9LEPT|nr:metallophosphoesterase [Leptospira ilyithenensis]TGN09728.1 phosphoesterase [Leptospira ilyithenensis]
MKIIYLTDIHDGLHGLKAILQNTEADLYLFSGDIIYKAFFSYDRIIDFCGVQEELYYLLNEKKDDITPYDFTTKAIRFPEKYDAAIVEKSHTYRHLYQIAAKTMKDKYEIIEKLIRKYAKSPVYCLPGNYDLDLQYTELYERDIHRKNFEFKGLKFSGYGGAPVWTSGIPEKLAVVFHEYTKHGKNYSEPEDFFREEEPDICVIHNPAYGFLDKIPGVGNIGSQGIRRYLDDYSPSLVVSGHVHEDQGVVKKRGTVYLNPSNFGPVDSVHGFQEGGYFAEIFIEDKIVIQTNLCQTTDEGWNQLIEVDCSEKNLKLIRQNPISKVSSEDFIREN